MDKKEFVTDKPNELAVVNSHFAENDFIGMQYELTNSFLYSFSHRIDKNIFVKLDESEQRFIQTDFIDADVPEDMDASVKRLYAIACAGGVFTGGLSRLHLSQEQLKTIREWKDRGWKKVVVQAAKLSKYSGDDFRGAAAFLNKKKVPYVGDVVPAPMAEAAEERLNYLAANPSVAGLLFSVLDQFGECHFFMENEKINQKEFSSYYTVGRTVSEKLFLGFMYWLLHLSIDQAMSKRLILDELGLPRELQLSVKELLRSKLYSGMPANIEESEKKYSAWLKKLFTAPETEKESEVSDPDGAAETFLPVGGLSRAELFSECIIRGFYLIHQLNIQCRELNITGVDELDKIASPDALSINSKMISRMRLISGGTYAAVNIAGAALKTLAGKKVGSRQFMKTFLTEIDVSGIGKFVVACVEDAKDWSKDVTIFFERLRTNKDRGEGRAASSVEWEMFDALTLDALQARILWSLEAIAVSSDIQHTTDSKSAEIKQMWLDEWKQKILKGFGYPDSYFSDDEDLLYNGIYELSKDRKNWRWFYLLTMELVLFKPYISLGSDRDKEYRKLSVAYDYVEDEFIRRQTIVSQAEVDNIKRQYAQYRGAIGGSRHAKSVGAGITTSATMATSGIALTCAPGIPIALAGEAVVGMHGAALTSSSHAFVDGGSLAAGGLGKVGGTSIITGGGALMGLVGSETASLTAVLSKVDIEFWIRQSAKLLTFAEIVLTDRVNDWDTVGLLCDSISTVVHDVTAEIRELEKEKNDLEKENIKKVKEYKKALERSYALLLKLYK